MSRRPTTGSDVVVIGGGSIGLSIAWRLAQRGLLVTLLDPAPGQGATWVAAGMLAAVNEAHFGEEQLAELSRRAAREWADFAAELAESSGLDVGYRRDGTLLVAADAGDRAVLERLLAFQRELGLPAHWLSAERCRELEPGLAPGLRGGVHAPDDHQVDNRRFALALLAACRRAGVEVREERAEAVLVAGGAVAGGAVTGVLSSSGELACSVVVLAAGYQSAAIGGLPASVLPPVRPVKGQILRLRARPRSSGATGTLPVSRTVRALVAGVPVYLVPRDDGGLVLGGTVEEAGEDATVTVEAVHRLLADGRRVVPGIDELELAEASVRFRPGSPDNAPLIGPAADGPSGLVVATGHYRNGILLAPVTAEAVTALLTGGSLPAWAEPFRADRLVDAGG